MKNGSSTTFRVELEIRIPTLIRVERGRVQSCLGVGYSWKATRTTLPAELQPAVLRELNLMFGQGANPVDAEAVGMKLALPDGNYPLLAVYGSTVAGEMRSNRAILTGVLEERAIRVSADPKIAAQHRPEFDRFIREVIKGEPKILKKRR